MTPATGCCFRLQTHNRTSIKPRFYTDTLGLGEIAGIGYMENTLGIWECAPEESVAQSMVSGSEASLQNLKVFFAA